MASVTEQYKQIYEQAKKLSAGGITTTSKKNKKKTTKTTKKTTNTKATKDTKKTTKTEVKQSTPNTPNMTLYKNPFSKKDVDNIVSNIKVAQPDYSKLPKSQTESIIDKGKEALKEREESFKKWYTEDKKDMLYNADGSYRDLRTELANFEAQSKDKKMTALERYQYNTYKKELEKAIDHSDFLQQKDKEKELKDVEEKKKFYIMQDAYNDTFGEKLGKKIGKVGASILNMPFQVADVVNDLVNPNFDINDPKNLSKQISGAMEEGEEQIQYNTNNVEQFALNTFEGVADFGAHFLLGMATGITPLATMSAKSGLSKYEQNRQQGYDEKTSLGNAVLTGAMTLLTEKIGLDNFTNIVNSPLGQFSLSALASQSLSEGAEEGLEYLTEPLIDFATLGKNVDYNTGELFMSVALGMASGGILGGVGNTISTVKSRKTANQLKADMQVLTDYANKNTLSDTESRVINEAIVLGNKALANFESKSVIGNAIQFESDQATPMSVEEIRANLYNFMQPQVDAESNTYSQRMAVQNILDNAQNVLSNKGIRMDALQYSNLDEDTKTQVDTLQKLATDLKQDVTFNSELKTENGTVIDGYYDNATGRIVINPLGSNPAMSTFVHELTHGTESSKTYERLKSLVKATDSNFDEAVQIVKGDYESLQNLSTEDAEKEYVAITLQEMLGNEEFVNRLVKYDTSLASRIYEGVKKVVFNTKTSQDIEYAFMKAFRDSGISEQMTLQYSKGLSKEETQKKSNEELDQIQNELLNQEKMTPQSFAYYLRTVDDMDLPKADRLERIYLLEDRIGTSLLKKKTFERYRDVYLDDEYNTYKEYREELKKLEEERSSEFMKRHLEEAEARKKAHEHNLKLAEEKKLTPEEHLANAKKEFGLTRSFSNAGYITTDGELLNFGHKKYGRGSDHREIASAFNPEELYDKNMGSGNVALNKFMNEGNIRIIPETNGLDLSVMPTQSQIKKIKEFIDSVRGQEFMVDISNEKGDVIKSFAYDKADIKRVIDDITEHFSQNEKQFSKGLSLKDIKKRLETTPQKNFTNAFTEKEWMNPKYLGEEYFTYLKDAEEQIKENGTVSDETKARIKDATWRSMKIEETDNDINQLIQEQKEIRKFMRDGSLSMESIGGYGNFKKKDFIDFKRKNMGNFTFTKNGGRGVDTVYQELVEQYPHHFDESITNAADQIEAIADFLNEKYDATRVSHLSNIGLETDEFDSFFESSFNNFVESVKNKGTTPIENDEFADLKSKYSDLRPELVNKAIDEVRNIGYVTESTKGALKDDLLSFFSGDESIMNSNPKAKNRINDFINDTVEHFATRGLYDSNSQFADNVATKVSRLLNGYAGISNEEIDTLYDEVSTIKKADALLKEKRDLSTMDYMDVVDDLIFKGRDTKGYMSQIERVFDKVANNDVELRTKLREVLEFPRYQAQIQYVKSLKKYNETVDQIVKMGIREGSKESKAVQWIMEKQREDGSEYTNADLLKEFGYKMKNGKFAYENIENAAKLLRRDYDDMFDTINNIRTSIYGDIELRNELKTEELQAKFELARKTRDAAKRSFKSNPTEKTRNVYVAAENELKLISRHLDVKKEEDASGDSTRRQQLKHRENYAHHTYEKQSIFLSLLKERTGVKEVPTKLAGVSDYAQPKSGYASFFKKRMGGQYEADALKGFAEYFQEASRIIAYDPLIEHYRNFTSALRNTAHDDSMSQFTRYMVNYTNALAGKTNSLDRPIRENLGDTVYGVLKEINSRVKANAILGNLKTSITQFANAPLGLGMLVKNGGSGAVNDFTKGAFNYLTSVMNGSSDKSNLSPFIQARFFDTDTDAVGIGAKVDDMFNFLLTRGDEVVTKMIWNAAYEQALRKGEDSPVFYADDLTRRTVAGRGHGEVPLALQSQVMNFLIPFQVETSNIFNNLKDMAFDPKSWPALLVVLLGNFVFDELYEKITGSRVQFDPINVIKEALENGDDMLTTGKHLVGETLGAMPGGNLLPLLAGMDSDETEAFFGDNDPTRYGTGNMGISAIKDAVTDVIEGRPLNAVSDLMANFALPGGGKQIQRSVEALQANGILPQYVNGEWVFDPVHYTKGGNVGYTTNPEAILDSPSNLADFVKQVAFGKWAGKDAQEYLDGFSSGSYWGSSKKNEIVDWLTSNDKDMSKRDALQIAKEIEEARDNFTTSNTKGELIEFMDSKKYSAKQKNQFFDTYYGDSKQVKSINDFASSNNLNAKQTYAIKSAVFTSEGKKASNKIDTIRNSKALEVRRKLDELGLYDKCVNYLLENELDLSSMGLNKKVAKMSNYEFETEYRNIFGESYTSKSNSMNDLYEKTMRSSSKSSKSKTSSTKKIDDIIAKARKNSSSGSSSSKVDDILEKLQSSAKSSSKTSNSELLKRYLKEHSYDAALFD